MIIPQKYCGLDLTNVKPHLNQNLIIANKYSFRIYKLPEMKILIDGLTFDKKVRAIYSQNEFMYIACKNKLYTIKLHVLDIQEYEDKIIQILVFHPIKIVATKHKLYINQNKLNFQGILGIMHLPTYLNKIILYTSQYIKIINIIQLTVITTIFSTQIGSQDSTITLIKETSALDVVAVALTDPSIVSLFNLQTLETLAQYQIDDIRVQDISLNRNGRIPIMAVAQENKLSLYNLNTQELMYVHKHGGNINWAFFQEDQSIYVGSSQLNSIEQFSLEEQKMMAVLRNRSGFQDSITKCSFYGFWDETLINSIAFTRNEIRYQSLVNENMTNSKKGNFNNFSYSLLRENDWANILTSNDKFVQLSNTFKTINTRTSGIPPDCIVQTFVTNCGNFGFVAHNLCIYRFTMQSGSLQKEYKLQSQFQAFFVDSQNQYIIVAEKNYISQIDFISGKTMSKINNNKIVNLMVGSKVSNILAISYQDNKIIIIDVANLKTLRSFDGHKSKILDMVITFDNQHVISSSLDKTLKIWNLVYGSLLQEITLQKPLISIDISQEQLIGVFLNSRTLSVWKSNLGNPQQVAKAQQRVNITYCSDISIKSKDPRSYLYQSNKQKQQKIETELDLYKLKLEPQDDSEYIRFTNLEEGRWVPIQHIDQIRDRNKVKLADADIKIPFFMDFRNADQERKNMLEDIKGQIKEKSKILESKKDKYLAELKSNFETIVEQNNEFKLFELMKSLNPTSYDYEIRSAIMGKPQNISKIFQIFNQLFQSKSELDLKSTYLLRFIEVARDDFNLIDQIELREQINQIQSNLELTWSNLEDIKSYAQCVIEFSKTRI